MRKILLLVFLFLFLSFKDVSAQQIFDATLSIDTSSNLGVIKPIWRTTASWKSWAWDNTPMIKGGNFTQNWFTDYFPFFDSVRVMSPIGGNTDLPPYVIPEILKPDGSLDFSHFDNSIDNILKAGLTPVLDLAQTPYVLRDNDNLCKGFCFYTSSIKHEKVPEWTKFIAAVIDHLNSRYGSQAVSKWGFASFNEPDSGRPSDTSSCSFTGTAKQLVNDVLIPTLIVLRQKNLLSNFHLGSFIGVSRLGMSGSTVETDNGGISSSDWLKYLFDTLKSDGFKASDFKSFGVNMYEVYQGQNIFWIKDSLDRAKIILHNNNFDIPLRSDELGLIYNGESNTHLYKSSYAASWFAAVLKLYVDYGNVDQVLPWWYLLLKNGGLGNYYTSWSRGLPYYTFMMYHQLSNSQRLSVTGGIFDRNSLNVIDAVSGKDANGVIKTIVFNHNDGLNNVSSAALASDPNSALIDKSDKKINLSFKGMNPGRYRLTLSQATDANITSSPKDVPVSSSEEVNINENYSLSLTLSHHSVVLVSLTPLNVDVRNLKVGWNKVSWLSSMNISDFPLRCSLFSKKELGWFKVLVKGWIADAGFSSPEAMIKCYQ